jgi:hypothetical protein
MAGIGDQSERSRDHSAGKFDEEEDERNKKRNPQGFFKIAVGVNHSAPSGISAGD